MRRARSVLPHSPSSLNRSHLSTMDEIRFHMKSSSNITKLIIIKNKKII